AITGVTQTAGMRVNHPQNAKATIGLADDATGEGLAATVEPDMGNAGIPLRAGGQGSQGNRLVALAQAHEHPAGFLVPVFGVAMSRVFLEEGTAHAVGQQDAAQRLQVLRPSRHLLHHRRQGSGLPEQGALKNAPQLPSEVAESWLGWPVAVR